MLDPLDVIQPEDAEGGVAQRRVYHGLCGLLSFEDGGSHDAVLLTRGARQRVPQL